MPELTPRPLPRGPQFPPPPAGWAESAGQGARVLAGAARLAHGLCRAAPLLVLGGTLEAWWRATIG